MHMDIAGSVLDTKNDDVPYLPKGMSGRYSNVQWEFLSFWANDALSFTNLQVIMREDNVFNHVCLFRGVTPMWHYP